MWSFVTGSCLPDPSLVPHLSVLHSCALPNNGPVSECASATFYFFTYQQGMFGIFILYGATMNSVAKSIWAQVFAWTIFLHSQVHS
jgi:hypothetical protein